MFPVLGFLLTFLSPKPTSWVFQPVSRSLHPHPAPLLRFSFRFWVFCLLFRLQNPPHGFFNLFPACYTHILLHFYDLVSGSGFSACFSVSKTHVVGFSACFPLATPIFCQLITQKRQESSSCRRNNLIRLQVLPWSHFFPRQYGMRSIPGSRNPSERGSDNSP